MRLFVALDLPDAVKRALEPLASGLGDVRWVPPGQQHLTIRFIGEVDERHLDEIAEALSLVPGAPFELRLKGIGHFPPRGAMKVLWVGIERNPELAQLKKRIDRVLRQTGLPPDERRFQPHVTLGRVRRPPSPDRVATWLMRHSLFASEPFPVSGFQLYSSYLKPDGAIHALESSYELLPAHFDEVG